MAVEITGTPVVFESALQDPDNEAYTIPSDAEAVIVIATGVFLVSVAHDFTALNWNNGGTVDFTLIVLQSTDSNETDLFAYIMTNTSSDWPGTGARELSLSLNSSVQDGQTYVIISVKGLDTTTPIRDTDQVLNPAGTEWTASLTGVVSGDLTFISKGNYAAGAHTPGSGQIEIHDAEFNSITSSTSWEDGEGSPSVTAPVDSYDAGIAFAIAQAVAAIKTKNLFINQAIQRAANF